MQYHHLHTASSSAGGSTSTTTRLQQGNNLAVVKASSSVSHLVGSYQRPVRAHTLACASQATLPRRGNCGSLGPTAGHRRIAGRGNHPVRCAITDSSCASAVSRCSPRRPGPPQQNAVCYLAAQTARQPPRFAIQLCVYTVLSSCVFNWLASSARRCTFAKSRPPPLPGTQCTTRRCPAA